MRVMNQASSAVASSAAKAKRCRRCMGKMKQNRRSVLVRAEAATEEPPAPPPPPTPSEYMQSLPGISAPFGFFDPLSLSSNCKSISNVKLLREAELIHGRVSMMAVIGFIFGEKLPLLNNFFAEEVTGPAVNHWQQAPGAPLIALSVITMITELIRADKGWIPPNEATFTMRDEYVCGDLGFDPLGMKPPTPDSLKLMQTRELNNGRLAMIAIMGFMTQEELFGKLF